MICEKCGKEHDGSYGSGRFCSVACVRRYARLRKNKKHHYNKKRAAMKRIWRNMTSEQKAERMRKMLESRRNKNREVVPSYRQILVTQEEAQRLMELGIKSLLK